MGADAYGFDINEQAITYARARFPKCRFFVNSYDQLAAIEEPFDFVFSSEVIEHVGDLDAYMSLLAKLTRDCGFVYITTPDMGSPNRPDNVLDWVPSARHNISNTSPRRTLCILFKKYGFSFVRKVPDRKTGLKVVFAKQRFSPAIQ